MKRCVMFAAGICMASGAAAETAGSFGPLALASLRGDEAAVSELLEGGADPNATEYLGLTPVSAGIRSCGMTVAALKLLLDAGGDVEARSGIGATPLMVAWQKGRADLAQALLAAGADPDARNMYGDTAAEYRDYFTGDLADEEFATLRHFSAAFARRADGTPKTYCPSMR